MRAVRITCGWMELESSHLVLIGPASEIMPAQIATPISQYTTSSVRTKTRTDSLSEPSASRRATSRDTPVVKPKSNSVAADWTVAMKATTPYDSAPSQCTYNGTQRKFANTVHMR